VKLVNVNSNLGFPKLCIIYLKLLVFAWVLLQGNLYGQVTEDEVSRACSTHWGEARCVQGFGGKARRKETCEVGGRIILRWILEK
jgi:hypothetical protein